MAASSAEGNLLPGEGEVEERLKALEELAQRGNEAALRQALHDPDGTVQMKALELLARRGKQQAVASLLDMTKSDQPAIRSQALRLLHETGYAGEGTVVAALGTALADKELRDYAIQALADRGGSDALEYLRQAFRDPDPAVRRLVLESAAPQGQSLPLLREAIADSDEAVRSFAQFWLKQAASEEGGDSVSNAP
jgi:HEAT repeat protein